MTDPTTPQRDVPREPPEGWRSTRGCGYHHYTPENIAAIVRDLKACEQGTEFPEWINRDHRTACGVLWRVISALAYDAAPAAAPAATAPSECRGYAHLGIGAYIINHSRAGTEPELLISLATEEEKRGRVVGDTRDNPPDAVLQPDAMVVRLRFENEAGFDALLHQLKLLREVHFSDPDDGRYHGFPPQDAAPAPVDKTPNPQGSPVDKSAESQGQVAAPAPDADGLQRWGNAYADEVGRKSGWHQREDGYWTPWHQAHALIEHQARDLAKARDALRELVRVITGPKLNDEGPSYRAVQVACKLLGDG